MEERSVQGTATGSQPSHGARPYRFVARSLFVSRPVRFERRRHDHIRYALHDRLGPALANLVLRIGLLEEVAGTTGCSKAELSSLKLEAAALVEELGRIVHGELPKPLELGDVVGAMREACHRAVRPGLRIDFTVSGTPCLLPCEVAELLYRGVLEGTANVVRHARAERCSVRLTFAGSFVSLDIRDNGQGVRARDPVSNQGLGLVSLSNSARLLGGAASLESLPTRGARLMVRLPLGGRARRPGGRVTMARATHAKQ